jgi:hypothetical protein
VLGQEKGNGCSCFFYTTGRVIAFQFMPLDATYGFSFYHWDIDDLLFVLHKYPLPFVVKCTKGHLNPVYTVGCVIWALCHRGKTRYGQFCSTESLLSFVPRHGGVICVRLIARVWSRELSTCHRRSHFWLVVLPQLLVLPWLLVPP